MLSLLLKGDAPCAVSFAGVGSGACDGPILGLVLFDTFAVSSTDEEPDRRRALIGFLAMAARCAKQIDAKS
jgi:hypothetical protein